MCTLPSDGQLVARLESGDLDALGLLYERHKNCVYRTALAITRDTAAAEDVLQDCFLRLHRYAYSVDRSLPLKPWLYRVTVNLAYDLERREKRRRAPLDTVTNWLTSPIQHSPEWRAEMGNVRGVVQDAISSLCIRQRVPIILFYLHSLNLKEIAQILDCPVGTIKSRLYYGRKNMRQKLAARHETPAGLLPNIHHPVLKSCSV